MLYGVVGRVFGGLCCVLARVSGVNRVHCLTFGGPFFHETRLARRRFGFVSRQHIVSQVRLVLFVVCSVAVHVVTGERFTNIGGVQCFEKNFDVELSDV